MAKTAPDPTPAEAPGFSIRLPRPLWMGAAAVVLVVFGATFLVLSYHARFWHRVVFIIPDGFRGGFVIFEDPNADDVPTERGSAFLYIPANGELRVRSSDFLRHMAEWSAKFAGGETLPIGDYLRPEIGDDLNATALWCRGYSSGSTHGWRYDFIVGNQRENDEFDFEGFKPGVGASGR